VNRLEDKKGTCRTGRRAVVASFHPHFGEEAPLVGRYGSGTIFISNCNLQCQFCQNFELSQLGEGREVSPEEMAAMMLHLQRRGCHNINIVSPTHVVSQVLEALPIAIEQGLSVPLVYNSGGYDSVETLRLLEGIFDIYMPDMKYSDAEIAREYSKIEDYPRVNQAAVKEMHRQVGDLVVNEEGVALRGLLIRHLILPHGLAGTEEIIRFIAEELSRDSYLNLMDQYRPCYRAHQFPLLTRPITPEEYGAALELAAKYGLRRLDQPRRWVFLLREI
jgi:putative pyruvate formate lyase activating enzyme